MMCVTAVSYNVVHKDCLLETIIPQQRLRQGCQLSPYLFILWWRDLISALINREISRGNLHRCKIAQGAPMLTHLLFADNCLLFLLATNTEAVVIKSVLDLYGKKSGQVVNYHEILNLLQQ